MEDQVFLEDYQERVWHRFKEIERYAALSQLDLSKLPRVSDDT